MPFDDEALKLIAMQSNDSAVGEMLTAMIYNYETHANKRVKFRKLLEQGSATNEGSESWNVNLIRLADQNDWPAWAVQCLPSLFIPLGHSGQGKETLLAWRYILELCPDPFEPRVLREYCGGQIVEAEIGADTCKFLRWIAPELELRRLNNPFSSETSMLGAVIQGISSLELQNTAEVRLLIDSHRKFLETHGIVPMGKLIR
jgi:hypothetical protein